jgi:methylglutaconyl-CoA hydratase
MTTDILLYERRQDAVWLILNRPEVRNALSRELIQALRNGFARAAGDDAARAVVLVGAGPVFCAGADLNQYREAGDREQLMADGGRLFDLLHEMTLHPKPIVARVQRAAYAGAFGLLCASDMVVAAEGTRFSLSEARLGLVAATVGTTVVRALGARNAKLHMLLAEPFGTDEALRVGLVQRVVPEEQLDSAVDDWLRMLRGGAAGALRDTKRILNDIAWGAQPPDELRRRVTTLAAERRADPEGQEGMASFLEKRRPAWNPEASE